MGSCAIIPLLDRWDPEWLDDEASWVSCDPELEMSCESCASWVPASNPEDCENDDCVPESNVDWELCASWEPASSPPCVPASRGELLLVPGHAEPVDWKQVLDIRSQQFTLPVRTGQLAAHSVSIEHDVTHTLLTALVLVALLPVTPVTLTVLAIVVAVTVLLAMTVVAVMAVLLVVALVPTPLMRLRPVLPVPEADPLPLPAPLPEVP